MGGEIIAGILVANGGPGITNGHPKKAGTIQFRFAANDIDWCLVSVHVTKDMDPQVKADSLIAAINRNGLCTYWLRPAKRGPTTGEVSIQTRQELTITDIEKIKKNDPDKTGEIDALSYNGRPAHEFLSFNGNPSGVSLDENPPVFVAGTDTHLAVLLTFAGQRSQDLASAVVADLALNGIDATLDPDSLGFQARTPAGVYFFAGTTDSAFVYTFESVAVIPDVVGVDLVHLPSRFNLTLSGPNPVLKRLDYVLDLPRETDVAAGLYDLSGRQVVNLLQQRLMAGRHNYSWHRPSDTPSGMYFLRLQADGMTQARKVVFLR